MKLSHDTGSFDWWMKTDLVHVSNKNFTDKSSFVQIITI